MSNFELVKQANGQNVLMPGQIVEFKGEGIGKPPGNKPWKKVVVEDMERERHTVTIRGNLPPATALNKPAQFTLSTYQGTYQGQPYTGYSGFCDVLPNYGQQPAQQQSFAPPLGRPTQSETYPRPDTLSDHAKQPKAKQPDWDAKDLRIAKGCALNNATPFVIAIAEAVKDSNLLDVQEIKKVADFFVDYIYSPKEKKTPGEQFAEKYDLPDEPMPAAQAEATFG